MRKLEVALTGSVWPIEAALTELYRPLCDEGGVCRRSQAEILPHVP